MFKVCLKVTTHAAEITFVRRRSCHREQLQRLYCLQLFLALSDVHRCTQTQTHRKQVTLWDACQLCFHADSRLERLACGFYRLVLLSQKIHQHYSRKLQKCLCMSRAHLLVCNHSFLSFLWNLDTEISLRGKYWLLIHCNLETSTSLWYGICICLGMVLLGTPCCLTMWPHTTP